TTPELHLRADLLRALPDSLQPPVIGAPALLEDLRIDATPVVPNPQAKVPRVVGDFQLDAARCRMGQGIEQGLSPDGTGLLHDRRIPLVGPAFDDGLEAGSALLRALSRDPLESRREIVEECRGATQAPHAIPGLGQDLVGAIERFLDGASCL